MLHRAKVLRELEAVTQQLFIDLSSEFSYAQEIWQRACADPELAQKIAACQAPWPLPTWRGQLDKVVPVAPYNKPYQLLSVDGSQIYPDKHQGTSCFLINIGCVTLQYGTGKKGIMLEAVPYVFADQIEGLEGEGISTVDVVNGKREELELEAGLLHALKLQKELPTAPVLFLFDGSLVFWHLESKEPGLKKYFLQRYCKLLEQFASSGILLAGYLSLPKSRELMGILRTVMAGFGPGSKEYEKIQHLVDASLASFFLEPGTRSIVFKSHSAITESYPENVAPHFFYFDVGSEIVRIEVPAYLAQNEAALATITAIILDQAQKGSGFPVGLAEAHELAVVKGPDRDFFYHLIEKLGIAQKRKRLISQKSMKKRGIAV